MEPVSKLERSKLRGLAGAGFSVDAGKGDSGADTEQSCAWERCGIIHGCYTPGQ
jgi:hypothetical protein